VPREADSELHPLVEDPKDRLNLHPPVDCLALHSHRSPGEELQLLRLAATLEEGTAPLQTNAMGLEIFCLLLRDCFTTEPSSIILDLINAKMLFI
jgi:hypothetical protein